MNNMQLQPGAYQLPNNCTAFVRAGKVIVSLKSSVSDNTTYCRDCHFFTVYDSERVGECSEYNEMRALHDPACFHFCKIKSLDK